MVICTCWVVIKIENLPLISENESLEGTNRKKMSSTWKKKAENENKSLKGNETWKLVRETKSEKVI